MGILWPREESLTSSSISLSDCPRKTRTISRSFSTSSPGSGKSGWPRRKSSDGWEGSPSRSTPSSPSPSPPSSGRRWRRNAPFRPRCAPFARAWRGCPTSRSYSSRCEALPCRPFSPGATAGWGRPFPCSAAGRNLAAACRETGLDPGFYVTRERGESELFPWEVLDSGVQPGLPLAGIPTGPGRAVHPPLRGGLPPLRGLRMNFAFRACLDREFSDGRIMTV